MLGIIMAISGFITWSALSASTKLNNLVVVAPVAAALLLLTVTIVVGALRKPMSAETETHSAVWGDLLLLSGFAAFCFALTYIGFDVATFLFVWAGVVMSGGKGLWQPPLFAAIFTLLLVKGFGSLFPYPMLTLVL
ncbi:hypothetical protein P775_26625 [Puniceibacterium antarcticum]|uniref:Tripartite tricarboxylate transporter TctB family protein n=1 Tax=Puniceibacterium antarcticum TaxID=1206336 RepID=A0A2G8QYD3_9RHOB|nr:hypothetical protein [Puniceibacterium antarcticum]PIL14282.1 hypothetical protein P775_26625 [Puniceibacterium antarcticum]